MEKLSLYEILDMFYLKELKDLANFIGLDSSGNKSDVISTIIQSTNKDNVLYLFQNLNVEELKIICDNLDIKPGKKDEMISNILSLIDLNIETPIVKKEVERLNLEATFENVHRALKECVLQKRRIKSEKDAENDIGDFLSIYFRDVVTQYNLGGYLGLKIDLDINNGQFGIEIKFADSFFKNTSEIFRLIGQAVYYSKKRYGENFIIAIAGTEEDIDEPILREAGSFLDSINIKWVGVKII